MTVEINTTRRSPVKRLAKWVGIAAGGIVVLAIALVVVLLLPPVRGKVLTRVLADVGTVLPGDLSVGKAVWPSLGTFEMTDILWIDEADTLVQADRVRIAARLAPLVHKDIRVEEVTAEGICIDVPAITARFGGEKDTLPPEPEENGGGFPRDGSLPGVPSIEIDSLYVTAPSIRISDELMIVGTVVSAGFDISHGSHPVIRVDTLTAKGAGSEWRVDELSLVLDLERGRVDGKGRGELSPYGPVHLSLSSDDGGRITLVLATEENHMPPDEIGIRLSGDVTHDGARIQSIAFDGHIKTPGTREFAKIPGLETRFEGFPTLDGISLAMNGTVEFSPELSADVTSEIGKNNWIENGEIAIGYDAGTLDFRRVKLDLSELSLDTHGSVGPDSIDVVADIHCGGTAWLAAFAPDIVLPEPLSAEFTARASRESGSPVFDVKLNGNGRVGGFEFDKLEISAALSTVDDKPSHIDLKINTMDAWLGVGIDVMRGTTLAAQLSPIVVQAGQIGDTQIALPGPQAGRVEYTAESGQIVVDGVRVKGDDGRIEVWMDVNRDAGGTYKLDAEWPEPPPLLTRLLDLSPGKTDSLTTAWRYDAPFEIKLAGTLETNGGQRTNTTGTFAVPGPRNIAPLLPDSARVDDMGPIRCDFAAVTYADSGGTGFDVALDFDRTDWIDSSTVEVRGAGGIVVLDTLSIVFDAMHLAAAGSLTGGALDLMTYVDIADSRFAKRFVSSVPKIKLKGSARIAGAAAAPRINASIEGAIQSAAVTVPVFTTTLEFDASRVVLDIEAPSGITTTQVKLERASVSARSIEGANKLMPVRISVGAAGERVDFFQSLRVDTVGGLTVDVDSLDLDVGGRALHLVQPFRIQLPSDSDRIIVDGLDLEGELGSVTVDGFIDPDSSNIAGKIAILFPEDPPPALLRYHLWPDGVDVEFNAAGKHNLTVGAHVDGFELVDGRQPALDLSLAAKTGRIDAHLVVADSSDAIIESDARLPATLSLYPLSFDYSEGDIMLDATVANLPIVMRMLGQTGEIPEDESVRLDGKLVVRGPVDSPHARASVGVDFTGWPKFSQYGLSVDAVLGSTVERDSLFVSDGFPAPDGLAERPSRDSRGVEALVRLTRLDDEVLTADGFYPITVSFDPPGGTTPDGSELDFRVDSKEIMLDDFDPLLPIDVGLGGLLTLNLRGSGPVDDAALEGSLVTSGFEVHVAEQASMRADSDIRLSGSSKHPSIEGEIVIERALIRVPDLPENLHPIEGEAILLRVSEDSLAAGDSTLVGKRHAKDREPGGPPIDADIHVEIKIPSGFWIRGKGLDIELSGNLTVKQKQGNPMVTGELRAVRGTLVALGRTLQLERGTVTFFGGDEINPSLDIVLATKIDGTEIQILFGGTVAEPVLDLVSIPEMSESDIMSVLLFGTTYDNLDDGQADLMKSRSAEMALSLGAAKIQQEFGGQVGVDVMQIKSTGRDNEGSALMLGKYLSPRVLVSYAQALDSESESFVSLEYFLRGQFKLESTFGQRGQTSLGIGWSKDY